MKQIKTVLSVLIIITFLFCAFFRASGLNDKSSELFVDTLGIYVCESDDNSVTVRGVTNSADFKYTFDQKVLSCCVTRGILYVLTTTNQPGTVMVTAAKNGEFTNKISIKPRRVSNNTKICVDAKGRIYLFDFRKCVEIYNSDGKYLKTTSNNFLSLIQINGKVYVSDSSGIYRLSGTSESVVCECDADELIYAASKDYIATKSGAVYSIKNGKRVLKVKSNRLYSIAAGSKYILFLNGNTINVYSKSSFKLLNSYKLSFTPYAVCAKGGKAYLISDNAGEISVKNYNESVFLSAVSTKNGSFSQASTKIKFGKFITRGRYIFLPPLTTRTEFRSETSFDGFTLKFNKSRGLGTGTKAVFTKDKETYTYTIVVTGDITGTGRITKNDVSIMFNCLFGVDKVGGVYKTAADMNGDGKLSNADLVMLDRKV